MDRWDRAYESIVVTQANRLIPKNESFVLVTTEKDALKKIFDIDRQVCASFGAVPGADGPYQTPGESYYKWADHIDLFHLDDWDKIRQDLNERYSVRVRKDWSNSPEYIDDRETLLKMLLMIVDWLAERYNLRKEG